MIFKGIMPALVTPLNKDESINLPVLERLIEDFVKKGADGFYIAGATGEGLNLRPSERKILAEAAVKATNGRAKTIVQVASTDFSMAVELARHAEAVGADAISATPPLFFHYTSDDVYNYYKALANAVHIPVMIYYNPGAGFMMNAKFAARCFEVDNITSIKWTSPAYDQMMYLKELTNGEMNIINGPDPMLLHGLNSGADGGIGTTYNFMYDYIRAVYDGFISGDIDSARKNQCKVAKIVDNIGKYECIPAAKALVEHLGYDVGDATFPQTKYSQEEKAEIIKTARDAGWEMTSL